MKKILFYITLIANVLLVTSCDSGKSNEPASSNENESFLTITKAQFKNANFELGEITLQPFENGIKATGFIDVPPANKAVISSLVAGYIRSAPLLIGDRISKGQALLTIESPEYISLQQEYLETKEQLVYLENEYNRQETLYKEKIASKKNYLSAESAYKSKLAMVKGLEAQLSLLHTNLPKLHEGAIQPLITLYSPINGIISKNAISVGKYITSTDELLEVINSEHKHLELSIFEKDLSKVKEDQLILFSTPENKQQVFKANVHLIGKSISDDRTVKIHGHLENEAIPFVVGMFVEATIITNSVEKLALPLDAIIENEGIHSILVLDHETDDAFFFEPVAITVGESSEKWTEIKSNQLKGKKILTKGAFMLGI